MNAKEKHQCSEQVYPNERWGAFHPHRCHKNATVERDGKRYCGTHDPLVVAAKNEKRDIEMRAKWKRDADTRRRESAMRYFCEGVTVEFMEVHRAKDILEGK